MLRRLLPLRVMRQCAMPQRLMPPDPMPPRLMYFAD